MELWDKVSKTDPSLTKQVQQRGGFTAVCAQAQVKKATEMFGKYGKGWGLKNCKYEIIGNEIVFDAVFYAGDSEFEMTVDMIYKAGQDCRKKLRTDAQSKSLSLLGFNSDIFEGKFDDNKYVNELRKEFSKPKELTEQEKKDIQLKESLDEYKLNIGALLTQQEELGLNKVAIINSIKKHLNVDKLGNCGDINALGLYYIHCQNKITELKKGV